MAGALAEAAKEGEADEVVEVLDVGEDEVEAVVEAMVVVGVPAVMVGVMVAEEEATEVKKAAVVVAKDSSVA